MTKLEISVIDDYNDIPSEKIEEQNIFYVISKIKHEKNNITAPVLGKIKYTDPVFYQSFCAADNSYVLNEFITTTTILTQDVVMYFFISLSAVNYFLKEMDKIKNSKEQKNILDISSKFNLLKNKKDLWVYFHQNNIKKYSLLLANDSSQVQELSDKKSVSSKACVIASYNDLLKIKGYMEKIINGEEDRFNKIESIQLIN